jgi:MoaA/NifB/PqqE/SkfB family radical SAM enzyme
MDKIQIVNVLLTRRCNLRCEYCNIVKDYKDKPKEYPNMKYYYNNELTPKEWINIIERIRINNQNTFFIFYGGEPFLYNGLEDILKYCNNNGCNYTVITNNTDQIQKRLEEIYKNTGQYKGLTSSVDPLILKDDDGSDIWKKSYLGFQRLIKYKELGIAKDVVSEITITKDTIQYTYELVKKLSQHNIYSSITCIDDKKSEYYDFSSISDKSLLIDKNDIIKNELQKIIDNKTLLVHIPELLMKLYDILPSNMYCEIYKNVHNITLDSDGSVRLCLRIKGVEKIKVEQLICDTGKINELYRHKMKKDYIHHCLGCNWTCIKMSEMFSNSIINH